MKYNSEGNYKTIYHEPDPRRRSFLSWQAVRPPRRRHRRLEGLEAAVSCVRGGVMGSGGTYTYLKERGRTV